MDHGYKNPTRYPGLNPGLGLGRRVEFLVLGQGLAQFLLQQVRPEDLRLELGDESRNQAELAHVGELHRSPLPRRNASRINSRTISG